MKPQFVALLAAAGIAASAAPDARAQATQFETTALAVASACLNSGSTPEAAPTAVATCDKLVADLETVKAAAPGISGHDLNVYHIVASMAQSRIAASFGRIDGMRTSRVCQRSEESWRHTAQIVPAHSPAYADMIGTLAKSATETIAKCRSEFGAPPGAVALP